MYCNYFLNLVNRFFKILPMKENGEVTLPSYIRGLQRELAGCKDFTINIKEDKDILSLLSILEYMADHPEQSTSEVRSDVFKAIGTCNKLHDRYDVKGGE